MIPRIWADHVVDAGHEKLIENVQRVDFGQAVGRDARHVQMPVAGPFLGVSQDLQEQAGDEIDRALELGHLFEVQRHAVIIFGAVQAHPGHEALAADIIGIIRLVLMPEKGERNRLHSANYSPIR
jgi:hypothetical protein